MDLQIRLAQSVHSFVLPISGCAQWQRTSDGWEARIELPPIPKAHIVVPSFAAPGLAGQYQFLLQDAAIECALHPVPAAKQPQPDTNKPNGSVTSHIDCWHTIRDVSSATIILRVQTTRQPDQYLLCVTVRELELANLPLPTNDISVPAPPAFSQMQADAKIRQRICSPTALAMALGLNTDAQWQNSVDACYDPVTQSYGAWPLAIRFASERGYVGSVESACNWDNAIAALKAGMPVVCSIRFKRGELSGAPLAATGGHLVCLYGVAQGKALVMDPAASDASSVACAYDIEEFTGAWLKHRGAAYYLGSAKSH
jgi:hypothetical protein